MEQWIYKKELALSNKIRYKPKPFSIPLPTHAVVNTHFATVEEFTIRENILPALIALLICEPHRGITFFQSILFLYISVTCFVTHHFTLVLVSQSIIASTPITRSPASPRTSGR